jgi:hypothetical protein
VSDNVWSTVNVDPTTGTWNLFRQAGNAYFPAPPAAQTLAAWNTDGFWGPKLFGAGAKVTSVQFGLGSSQRDSISYVDYLQTSLTSLLNGGDLIDFGGGPVYVDDVAGDYTITVDADTSGTLTNGDIVTWNPSGTQHGQGTVEDLTFGVNAFLTVQDAAINAADEGDPVYVAAGTYSENVTIGKDVDLVGAAGLTTLQPSAAGNTITINGSGFGDDETVSIDNVNFNGLNGLGDYGIRVQSTRRLQGL